MNWDAIGAIGQVLGSLAVFVTLVYLAAQVRQARRQMQRAATDNRAATVRQLMLTQLTDERLMSIFEKVTPGGPAFDALAKQVGLAPEEAHTWFTWQSVWFQYRAATISYIDDLPPGERATFDAALRMNYQVRPASSAWYQAVRTLEGFLNPDAVRYIDNLLAQPQ
jgi:hypothetical protein